MNILEPFKKKKKIGFWAGDDNNFYFVNPIIDYLSKYYKVEKYSFVDDLAKLEYEISKVDLAWMEWGQGPIGPASNFPKTTPIINRIHRYEVYLDTIKYFNYKNVDRLIFISPGVEKRFALKFADKYSETVPIVVPIGVDNKLFSFKDKPITKKIIFVGRIHHHKNPALLLQIIKRLVQIDEEYTATIIGDFQDEVYKEMFFDQLNKLNLKQHVTHHSHMKQEKLVGFLQQADFFVLPSVIEGYSIACAEAMLCGARPVISNYFGSDLTYPKKILFNTVDEAVDIILNPRLSRLESREMVLKEHDYDKQMKKIKNVCSDLLC